MRWSFRFPALFFLFWACASCVPAETLRLHQERYAKFQTLYDAQIEKLATWCEEQGLTQEAKETRALNHTPRAEDQLFVAMLPQEVQSPELAEASEKSVVSPGRASKKSASGKPSRTSSHASAKEKNGTPSKARGSESDPVSGSENVPDGNSEKSPAAQWQTRIGKLRLQASSQLFRLACGAMEDGHSTYAFELLMRALEENPDYAPARRILGYENVDGQWLSPFEKSQLRTMVHHPQFGWLPRKFVERYENGERFANGRWVTAKEDAAIHFEIENGWAVETPHFTIVTNHSLPAAVKIGEEVEVLYRVWKQLFLRYFATDSQLKALFEGRKTGSVGQRPGSGTDGRHRVFFFRNQENYQQYLTPRYPMVAQSSGLYLLEDRASYFFAGEKFDRATLLHEVTHQLFSEVQRTSPNVAQSPNFWMIEGIATYMESLHDQDRYHIVGGFSTPRMLAARLRFTRDHFYVPLKELSAFDSSQFQAHPEMVKLYSESSGLMQFLLHANDGQYRDAVSDLLREIYSGQATPNSIPRFLGQSFEELDSEYREFISRNPKELEQWEFD